MHPQQSEIHFYEVGAPTPTIYISCKSPHNSQDTSHICKTGYWTINCTELSDGTVLFIHIYLHIHVYTLVSRDLGLI
eukprot:SAG11_NODE_14424_length_612_cov_1.241715_1_plen_77_part_00